MEAEKPGTVFWLTGLAGAGKSTLAQELAKKLRGQGREAILLDGDVLRELFITGESTYTKDERQILANQYIRLCDLLSAQGVDVICATISLFQEIRDYAQQHIRNFRLVYLQVPLDTLRERDQKQLYSRAERGEIKNVMGADIPFDEPKSPDLIIENDGTQSPTDLAGAIIVNLLPEQR